MNENPTPTTTTPTMPELLTERQAAQRLGVARGTMEAWRIRGRGPRFVKVGTRAIRYTVEDLAEFIGERQRFRSTSEYRDAK